MGRSGKTNTIAASCAAPAGMGSPTKKRASTTCFWTLKRASLRTPQARNRKAAGQPARGTVCRAQQYASSAGATPNDTASARLSYSAPNSLWVFVRRAIRPSSMSRMTAPPISGAASAKRPSRVFTIDQKPRKRFPVVKRLGQDRSPPTERASAFQVCSSAPGVSAGGGRRGAHAAQGWAEPTCWRRAISCIRSLI